MISVINLPKELFLNRDAYQKVPITMLHTQRYQKNTISETN